MYEKENTDTRRIKHLLKRVVPLIALALVVPFETTWDERNPEPKAKIQSQAMEDNVQTKNRGALLFREDHPEGWELVVVGAGLDYSW